MGLVAAAWLLGSALPGALPVVRVSLIMLGLVAVGSAIAAHLPFADSGIESRAGSAGMWMLGVVTLVVAGLALDPAWDSYALLFHVLMLVCVAAAILTVLPPEWRRLAISLIILFHFGGILVAVTVVPPPGGESPWVSAQLWTRIYRPYLTFTNLNNGYHFYAPEPGPCAAVWFRIEFADGSTSWSRIPKHDACHNHVERRRLGALATAIGQAMPFPPPRNPDEALVQDTIVNRRMEAGMSHQPPIPPDEGMPLPSQYREPGIEAKMMLASFARHVARTAEHPLGLASPVVGIKIYRVDCYFPLVEHFQAGRDPLDPTLYQAYYQGEYDRDGVLKGKPEIIKNAQGNEIGRIIDPYLYWLIPIVRVPDEPDAAAEPAALPGLPVGAPKSEKRTVSRWKGGGRIINYVRIHAGDKDEETTP
jgi:hypothetical protein